MAKHNMGFRSVLGSEEPVPKNIFNPRNAAWTAVDMRIMVVYLLICLFPLSMNPIVIEVNIAVM